MPATDNRPRVALTMGDVAGVGPEVLARAWNDPTLHGLCKPLVIGDPDVLRKAITLVSSPAGVVTIDQPELAEPSSSVVPCLLPIPTARPRPLDRRAGRAGLTDGPGAAYDFLIAAIDMALAGRIDAITTLPLTKESLHLAGISHPGHTEILAERCKSPDHAMMLYLAANPELQAGEVVGERRPGLGVVHVTLHVALREVFALLSTDAVASKIRLADRAMWPLTGGRQPRVAVSSLNPHAGENGLFGDEEILIIKPAVEAMQAAGFDVHGPFPNDTLYHQALSGAFDAVVAMYHDQGHIALKTAGFRRAVNVTLGLPSFAPAWPTARPSTSPGRASPTRQA